MKTRVIPQSYDSHNSKRWSVEVFSPNEGNGGRWVTNSYHRFFWKADWKAHRLARYSLAIKENPKDKFVSRLKDGDETE